MQPPPLDASIGFADSVTPNLKWSYLQFMCQNHYWILGGVCENDVPTVC